MIASTILREDAVERLGKAIYGEEWIEGLSHRQWWLMDTYQSASTSSAVFPGTLIAPPAIQNELDLALDRLAWMESQLDACHNWLINTGFPEDLKDLNRADFDSRFAEYFSSARKAANSTPNSRTAEIFIRECFAEGKKPTLVECRAIAKQRFKGGREMIDRAYHKVAREEGIIVKPGPRIVRNNSSEK
jgi:hypothetical protein